MKRYLQFFLLGAFTIALGSIIGSCGGNEKSEMAFSPYEYNEIADGADSDSLRKINPEFDGRWSVMLSGVLPDRLGDKDVAELRDSLLSLAGLREDEKGKQEIALPSELINLKDAKNVPDSASAKSPGSYLINDLSLDLLTPKIAVFRNLVSTYAEGAAHGSVATSYVNYDIKGGEIITFAHIFTQGFQKLIVPAIYNKFEEEELDLYVDREELPMATQFRLTPTGIEFIYGLYQIAPYSCGEPKVFFSYGELSSILNPEGKKLLLSAEYE